MMFIIFYILHKVSSTIFLNNVSIFQERGDIKIKLLKQNFYNDQSDKHKSIKIELKGLRYNFNASMLNTTEWLGLPWETIKTFELTPEGTIASSNFFYYTIEFYPKTENYYTVSVIDKNKEYMTTPLYYSNWGFLRPLKLENTAVGQYTVNNNLIREYSAIYDDYTFSTWAEPFIIIICMLIVSLTFIISYIVAKATRPS